jgi:uncharacterized protein
MADPIRDRLAGEIARMPAINTHEHSWQAFSPAWAAPFDLPSFFCHGYVAADLTSAGLKRPPDLLNYLTDSKAKSSSRQAWETIRPFLERVSNTSYFRYLLYGMADLFGVSESEIFSDGWQAASSRLEQFSREHAGRGADLCRRMNVTATVIDAKLPPKDLARTADCGHRVLHVARLDSLIIEARGLASELEQHPAKDFDDWLALFDQRFQQYLAAGVAGFKSGLAYNRRIQYGDPTKAEATAIFRKGILTASPAEKTIFQDFMMNYWCRKCVEVDKPMQVHAGIQAGNSGTLEDTRPTGLNSLFQRHGDLRVDLFHGGYPWTEQAGIMAKYFPNVHINGCWLHSISASGYRQAIRSWIQAVPMSKIFAWGGDSAPLLEHSYASLLTTRRLLADVLAGLIREEYLDMDLALELARRMLHDNAATFWRLER